MKTLNLLQHRAVQDFRLQLVTAVAILTVVFVSPFAVYRLVLGPLLAGAMNAFIVVAAVLIAAYAWVTKNIDRAGKAISVVLALSALTVTTVLGLNGVLWFYAIIIFVFYLSPPILALALILTVLGGVAAIELSAPRRIFAEPDELASFLASAATTAVFSWLFASRNAKQRQQLFLWATRDPLTGLENRRSLDHELDIAVSTARRERRGYGLIIMDTDNFKGINDNLGHAAGDETLCRIAEILGNSTRLGDRLFRYGGDEFTIILPNVDAEALHTVAGKLVQSIAEYTDAAGTPVTVSVGAALLGDNEDKQSWNRRADRSMYRAKKLGGNRYIVDQLV